MSKFIKRNWAEIAFWSLVILMGCLVWANLLIAEPIDQYHSSWHEVRAAATEDATDFATALALATSKGDFANKPAGAFQIPSRYKVAGRGEGYSQGTRWMFAVCGGPTENDTFSFNLVGWAKGNGMAQVICEGNGVLGTQDVVVYPGGAAATAWWVDTLAIDETTKWPRDGDAANVQIYNSGDNEVALLVVETTGLEWIQFIVYAADGSGTEMTDTAVYGRRY